MSGSAQWVVTGSTGLLGAAVRASAHARGLTTIGISRARSAAMVRFDLCAVKDIPGLLDRLGPAGVFHLAAMARPSEVERNPALARRLNVDATAVIAEWCARNHSKLVFASSDWVFDGESGPYRESDEARPATLYGQLKLEAEAACLSAGGAVARLGWLLDDRSLTSKDFISSALRRLRAGETVVAVDDERRTPIDRGLAAEYILELGRSSFAGVVHVGGSEHFTPYDLLRRRARSLNLPLHHIERGLSRDLPPGRRPRDVRLDTSRLRRILPRMSDRQTPGVQPHANPIDA